MYLTTELFQHEAHTDEDKFLLIKRIPLKEAVDRVMAGELRDAKTIMGIYWLFTACMVKKVVS